MFVQALVEYADRYLGDELATPEFTHKPVHHLIEIDNEGNFNAVIPQRNPDTKKVLERRVAVSPTARNSGIKPLLACDAVFWVMGPHELWSTASEQANHQEKHEGFVALHRQAAADTQHPVLQAIAAFYENPEARESALQAFLDLKAKKSDLVSFQVRPGGLPFTHEAIRDWWSAYYREHAAAPKPGNSKAAAQVPCLVSGEPITPPETHPKIKGTASLGGQPAGVALMSFDKKAFMSYGWNKNQNSPVSTPLANAYVAALNDLLRLGKHKAGRGDTHLRTRTDIGGNAFLYWTRQPAGFTYPDLLETERGDALSHVLGPREDKAPVTKNKKGKPPPAERPPVTYEMVKNLFASIHTRNAPDSADPDTDRFYFARVSGNGGRFVVRQFHDLGLAEIEERILDWFRSLSVPDAKRGGRPIAPPAMSDLLLALSPRRVTERERGAFKEARELKANGAHADALYRRALFGVPLGHHQLATALERARRDHKTTQHLFQLRCALIRIGLNDLNSLHPNPTLPMPDSLDESTNHPAFLCGRLFSLYDNIQRAANKGTNLNSSIRDRYFTTASMNPKNAFAKIDPLSKAHLRKLRRSKPGLAVELEREVSDLCARIVKDAGVAAFPERLSLADQGRFVLGFHYQESERRRIIAEKIAAREVAQDTQSG